MKRYIRSSYENPYDKIDSRVAWDVDMNNPVYGYCIKTDFYDFVLYSNDAKAAQNAGKLMVDLLKNEVYPYMADEIDEDALASAIVDNRMFPTNVGISVEGITSVDHYDVSDEQYLILPDNTEVEFIPVGRYRYRV